MLPGPASAALLALALAQSAHPQAFTADARFGLVGTGGAAFAARFGIASYTLEGNYPASGSVFSSVNPANDPDAGFSVVREVAKLNVRNDNLGESNAQFQAKLKSYATSLGTWYVTPSFMRGSKPAFTWYSPKAAALASAESLQIVETIRREKARSPAITGTVWEIGNEPNLFPAITPHEYAALFAAYRRIIKGEDPGATVAMGSLFLPEPAEDLKAKLGEELEASMRTELQAAGTYNTLVSLGVFDNLVADVTNTLLARMLKLSAREYLGQALAATSARPDIVTLHVYPFDDRAPTLDSAALRHVLDTTVNGVATLLSGLGASAPVWVTEFGNIEQSLSESAAAARMIELIGHFRGNPAWAKWFHYKSTGQDEQFALFSSGTPPITRLAADAGFAPADGNFGCDKLNALGLAFHKESHAGQACRDNAPPAVDSARADQASLSEGDSTRVRAHASDANGDSLAYVWLRENGDTLGRQPEAVFRAGPADAGTESLKVEVRDAFGGLAVRIVEIAVANVALRPAVLNAAGSALSQAEPLRWDWEAGRADPDFDAATLRASVEVRTDSASPEPSASAPSVQGQWSPALQAPSGPVWARVRFHDGAGHVTAWSEPRRLVWAGSPSAAAPRPAAFAFRAHPGAGGALMIRLDLPEGAPVAVELFDPAGRGQRLFQGRLPAGSHGLAFPSGARRADGLRFLRLRAGGRERVVSVLPLPPLP